MREDFAVGLGHGRLVVGDPQVAAELAYLYADESEFASAAKMWARVMESNPSAMAAYHYAVAQNRAGNTGALTPFSEELAALT